MSNIGNPYDQVEFDFSIDEAVALQTDFVKSTREGRSWRKREQRNFVVALIGIATAFVILKMHAESLVLLVTFIAAITLIGLFLAVPFGWYYDHVVQSRTARLLAERMGPGPHHCSIEIHPDALRVAQAGVGFMFPWSSAVGIDDASDGVLISFTTGRVLARARGFTSLDHRQQFVRRLHEFVSQAKHAS